ncbi:MAG: hypothetical protein ACTS6O_05265 [Giesbergeria sp.]
MSKPGSISGLLNGLSAVYLVVSACVAMGLLVGSFASGIVVVGAPGWAWALWSIAMLSAISITYFFGERRRVLPILMLGLMPLIFFLLIGAFGGASADESPTSIVPMHELFDLVWVIALVIAPFFLMMVACVEWRIRRSATLLEGEQ